MNATHISVLPVESLALLAPRPGEVWADCTTGAGGHARLIADALGPTGMLLALDQDETMLALARPRLEGTCAVLVPANFDQLPELLAGRGIASLDGVFADLGFCSDQLHDAARGFSFQNDGPLDMRLDARNGFTAADAVNTWSERTLADVFFEYGEERLSRRIARRIVERRPFNSTRQLADFVRTCVPRSADSIRIHPATRVFQALRIAVNDELGALDRLLAMLPKLVKPGGRAGVISFHSLEDRRAKQAFRDRAIWRAKTKKPVEASDAESARNPRARSAKLRVAERLGPNGRDPDERSDEAEV